MTATPPARRYRFGVFEADSTTGELRRQGVRIKIHSQPFQILFLFLERPGQILTREEICRELWPDGTFVDYEHGVNSAINRLRDALGDKASNPRFVETLARRGYRFLAPVEEIGRPKERLHLPETTEPAQPAPARQNIEEHAPAEATPDDAPSITGQPETGFLDKVLATPEDLPQSPQRVVQLLFVLLQLMYLGFYVGALANLAEINELMSPLPWSPEIFMLMIVTAAIMIPARVFLICAVLFHAPGLRQKFLRLWWFLLVLDVLWSLAPFLLLHHINYGLALACMTLLVYSPFAQRSLILMGAGRKSTEVSAPV